MVKIKLVQKENDRIKLRHPVSNKCNLIFKDKSKYTRKSKHKSSY